MQKDIHEADINHLKRAVATYKELCKLYPKTFTAVHGTAKGTLKRIEEVHAEITQLLAPIAT